MYFILANYFLLFLLYAFMGWCMEVIVVYFSTKKFVDRGFLIGPICPIYGLGSLLIVILLQKYVGDPLVLFVMSVLICSFLEYFTSYLMEKLFKARWWDYSNKRFHINGRICLDNCAAFGILGVLMLYFVNPFFTNILYMFPYWLLYTLAALFFLFFVIDNLVSLKIITGFKNVAKSIHKDSTEEITKKVREKLVDKGGLYKRLVSAFNFEASEKLLRDIQLRVSNTLHKAQESAKATLKREKENAKKRSRR